MCSIACIIPIPLHKTGYDGLSEAERAIFNDSYESEANHMNDLENYIESQNQVPEVQNLDWFNVVNDMFTKYTLIAQVIDVKTKKSYFVERVGGYNHADVQPINAKNTAIMKEIYNGVWSWVRRPVWVYVNGVYVAGSINGMPHGFSLIEGNNMNGHTCIHFKNSKTHGTKRVDEAHQSAIAEAYSRRNELYQYLANN
jgi:hypothetical protein